MGWKEAPLAEPGQNVVLEIYRPRTRRPNLPPRPDCKRLHNHDPAGCRRVPAGAEGVDARGRAAVSRYSQGLPKVPRHMPRLALGASAST